MTGPRPRRLQRVGTATVRPSLQPHGHPACRGPPRPLLRRDRPLALSRLLWEIGTEGGEVVALRASGPRLRAAEADAPRFRGRRSRRRDTERGQRPRPPRAAHRRRPCRARDPRRAQRRARRFDPRPARRGSARQARRRDARGRAAPRKHRSSNCGWSIRQVPTHSAASARTSRSSTGGHRNAVSIRVRAQPPSPTRYARRRARSSSRTYATTRSLAGR